MPTTGDVTTNTIKHIAIETKDDNSNELEYKNIGADGINVDIYRDSDTGKIIDENMLPLDPEPSCESVATTLKNHEEEAMWKHAYCYNSGKIREGMGGIGSRNFIKDEIPAEPSDDYNRAIATGETITALEGKINSNFAESYDSSATYQNGDFSINNNGVLQKFNGTDWAPKNVTDEIKEMKSTFQNGVDTIYGAIVAQGITPASSTPEDCAVGITAIASVTWEQHFESVAFRRKRDSDSNSIYLETAMIIYNNLSNIKSIRTGTRSDNDSMHITFKNNDTNVAHYTNVGRNVNVSLPQSFDQIIFEGDETNSEKQDDTTIDVYITYQAKNLR